MQYFYIVGYVTNGAVELKKSIVDKGGDVVIEEITKID